MPASENRGGKLSGNEFKLVIWKKDGTCARSAGAYLESNIRPAPLPQRGKLDVYIFP